MMKEQIMQNISAVLGALNNVDVRGKANLANMTGSIEILERVLQALNEVNIVSKDMPAEDGAETEE